MSTADSPRLEYTADGQPPEKRPAGRLIVRVVIVTALVMAVALNAYAWIQGNMAHRLTGTDGTVSGQVLLPAGGPLPNAEVFLLGAPAIIVRTDADGRFTLQNVPTGEQILIVGYAGRGVEFPLSIGSSQVTQLGPIAFETPVGSNY